MNTELEHIKQLLLGEEYEALLRLKEQLDDEEIFSERVAQVISEALQLRGSSDNSVSKVLAPTIDQAIAGSINQDPHKLAESLYPIMGPAIRKSISETLQQMLENFNQLLEQGFSPRALRWRFQAWRTGKSYSEIVLLNTLEYQVEQVFFIHRETSLLLCHVVSDSVEKRDPDMVSGMLSAIQSFIEDSFSVDEGDVLDTLKLGDLTVVIQRGPSAVLAAVVRGRVPESLRTDLAAHLETLHRVKRKQLMNYEGDPAVFLDVEQGLKPLLVHKQARDKRRKVPWLVLFAVTTVLILLVGWLFVENREAERQQAARNELIELLNSESGIVVLDKQLQDDKFVIKLLADPHAREPSEIQVDPLLIQPVYITRAFLSLEAPMTLLRALDVLAPEAEVEMAINKGTLVITGKATTQWLETVEKRWSMIAGIEALDVSGLASHNPVRDEIRQLTERIETVTFQFPREGADVDSDLPEFQALVSDLKTVIESVHSEFGKVPGFDLVGYTDETGSQRFNQKLGLQRAESLKALLISNGVVASSMQTFSGLDYDEGKTQRERKTKIIVHYD